MARFRYDTELMTNMVAAAPVAAHTAFSTFLQPKTRRPAVLGVSSGRSPTLELIAEDADGHRNLYDFGQMIGVPAGSIQCFAAQQANDLRIYAVIAFKDGDTKSKILILKPFSLDSLDNIPKLELRTMSTVHQFFMGPVATDGEWPLIIAAHERLDRVGGGSDLSRILVHGDTWEELPQFKLPENATKVLDVCAASSPVHGTGVWCLYVIQGENQLIGNFASQDRHGRTIYQLVKPKCPAGANKIESFVLSAGSTALLIGARDGLRYLDPRNSIEDNGEAELICDDDIFKSPEKLSVAQDGQELTIWSLGKNNDLGYARTRASQVRAGNLTTIPLMPASRSTQFSATISQKDLNAGLPIVTQSIISNDAGGNLSWLQQNTDTGIWKEEPFVVGAKMEVYDVESYTINITAIDANEHAISSGSVRVTADSIVQAWVNGVPKNISSEGTRFPLDSAGELNLIVPTSGIAGRVLALDQLQDSERKSLTVTKTIINPSAKVMQAFAKINDTTDLNKITGRDGQPLFKEGDPRPDVKDMKQAAVCFGSLNTAMADLSSGKQVSSTAVSGAEKVPTKSGNILMDAYNYVKHKVREAYNWVVQKVGQAWEFVCEIAGKTQRFILDCVEKVGEAAMWVWNKIKLGVKKLIDFAGFLFNWSDIKETRNTIAAFLDAGIAYGGTQIKSIEAKVEKYFTDLEQKIVGPDSTTDGLGTGTDVKKPPETTEAQHSCGFKWILERMKNGGVASSLQFKEKKGNNDVHKDGNFEEVFAAVDSSVSKALIDTAYDISLLFKSPGSVTSGAIWRKIGKDFLKDGIRIVKTIVIAMLKFGEKLLTTLSSIGKYNIEVRIISGLWKRISGRDLTLFDIVTLILAILTTVLSKLVIGEKPPTFANIDADFIAKMTSNGHTVDTKKDIVKFMGVMSVNVAILGSLWTIGTFFSRLFDKGVDEDVQKLTPGKAGLILSTLTGIVGAISAFPTDPDIPGYDHRVCTVGLSAATIISTAFFTFTISGKGGAGAREIFNCIVALANFGLYNAIYIQELQESAQFKGKDRETSTLGIIENVLATVSSAGKCIAVTMSENIPAAALGLTIMHSARYGLAINKGFTLNKTLKLESLTTRGVIPPM